MAAKSPLSGETWPGLNLKVTPGEKKEDPYEFFVDVEAVKRKFKIPKMGNANKKRRVNVPS